MIGLRVLPSVIRNLFGLRRCTPLIEIKHHEQSSVKVILSEIMEDCPSVQTINASSNVRGAGNRFPRFTTGSTQSICEIFNIARMQECIRWNQYMQIDSCRLISTPLLLLLLLIFFFLMKVSQEPEHRLPLPSLTYSPVPFDFQWIQMELIRSEHPEQAFAIFCKPVTGSVKEVVRISGPDQISTERECTVRMVAPPCPSTLINVYA